MGRTIIKIGFWLIIIGIGIFLAKKGNNIPMKDLMSYFDSLQGLSEALFAIIGVWIGIVFPDVLKELNSLRSINDLKNKSLEFTRLVYPTLASIISIAIIALLRFLYIFKDTFNISYNWIACLKVVLILISYSLTIGLVIALFYAVIPLAIMNYMIIDTSYTKEEIIKRDKLVQKPQNEDD